MIAFLIVAIIFVAWTLVGLMRRVALRVGLLDVPNARSSHPVDTPRGGGLVIVVMVLFAALFEFELMAGSPWVIAAWIVGGGLVAAAGFLDDLRGLPAITRFGFHSLAAIVLLVASGGMPPFPTSSGTIDLGILGWLIGGIAITWSINLYNFMDGIDGLAASQCIFVAGGGVLLGRLGDGVGIEELPLLALAGASAGFLVWNVQPAKIFMGDVGSGFIGFALAAGAFLTTSNGCIINLWTWVVLNGLFFADSTATLVKRLMRGERVYEAHRLHAYQHLSRRWGSHRAVTILYSAINLVWCLPWAVATVKSPAMGPLLTATALVPLFVVAVAAGAGRQEI